MTNRTQALLIVVLVELALLAFVLYEAGPVSCMSNCVHFE